jgi:hypothetical protein
MSNTIIEQERHGIWIAASFILALLALALAFSAFVRTNSIMVGMHMEMALLNDKIETNKAAASNKAPVAAPVEAPAAVK